MKKIVQFYTKNIVLTGLIALFLQSELKAQDSLHMQLVYHWTDTTIIPEVFYGSRFNEIWGMAVDGREYAVMGSTEGLHVFDVTNPTSASQVVFHAGLGNPQFIIHRDFKTYGQYLYEVSDEDDIGLRIYDMQHLPDSMPMVYSSDTLFRTSHNIFIDEDQGRLYVCNVRLVGGGFFPMTVYSLANPLDPQFEYSLTGIGHAHDVYVRNDTAYVNAGGDGLWVVDYSGTTPQILNTLTSYTEQGYNHSGWLTDDGNTYVFADETHGKRLKIMDVTDINNWQIVSLIGSGIDSNSIAHNQMIRGNLLFSSYYYDGLRVFDIVDPANPQQVAWYDTYQLPNNGSYEGNWGVYCRLPSGRILASDMQSGLFVLEVDNSILVGTEKVEFHQLENVALWPNPIRDRINLNLDLPTRGNFRIDLYTVDGRWVKALLENTNIEKGQQQFQFNLEADLPSGVYFIKGYSPNAGSFIKTLVKE